MTCGRFCVAKRRWLTRIFASQVGMGVGSLSMIVPMYVAECAPPELRGLLIGLQQFAIEFGIMVSFWIVSVCRPIRAVLTFLGLRHQLHRRHWKRSIRCCLACPSRLAIGPCFDSPGRHDFYALHSSVADPPRPRRGCAKNPGSFEIHAGRP